MLEGRMHIPTHTHVPTRFEKPLVGHAPLFSADLRIRRARDDITHPVLSDYLIYSFL